MKQSFVLHLLIKPANTPNSPAVLLHCLLTASSSSEPPDLHDCLDEITDVSSIRQDLSSMLFEQGVHVFLMIYAQSLMIPLFTAVILYRMFFTHHYF